MKFARLLLPCLMLLALAAPTTRAYDGLGGLGLAYLYGYGQGGFNGYAVGAYNRSLPYFSLHPPVYYGQRYARPYGVSPFATWPQVQASAGYVPVPAANRFSPHSACCPAIIDNPHVPAEMVPTPTGEKPASSPGVVHSRAVEPLIIENPHFDASIQYTASRSE